MSWGVVKRKSGRISTISSVNWFNILFLKSGYTCGIFKINENTILTLDLISLVRRTMRCSTAKAFLRSARNRKNLDIITEAQVLKVLVDKVAKRAYGVKYLRNGKVFKVKAGREVILSAGALNSPQLLMLSGIGRS